MLLPILLITTQVHHDPRGPVQSELPRPRIGFETVSSTVPAQIPSPSLPRPTKGQWIWTNAPVHSGAARFRKSIELTANPKHVWSWISAEVRYRIWINGVLVGRGPADAGRDYDTGPCGPWFEDRRDLARFFHTGINAIAVEVFDKPLVYSDAETGHPGLKANFSFDNAMIVGTDSSWKTSSAEDLDQSNAKNGYRMDLNLEPTAWQESTYDDSQWKSAILSQESSRPTLNSEIPSPLETILPAAGITNASANVGVNRATGGAKFQGDGKYRLHYGHILSGYLGFHINGHKGTRLLIMPNEHDATGWNRRAEIILRDGDQFVELPYFDSFSVVNIEAVGVQEPIEIRDVRCVFTSYPVQYLGSFSCSDPHYNELWKVCRWVTQICMQTHHLDSPHHQEPISDAGDYLIESLNALYAFGDGRLAKQDLKKIARTLVQRKYQSFHTSYSLLWLRMLMQYRMFTGDDQTVRELAPNVHALLKQFESYIGENGLISEAPNYMFMDWVEIAGFNSHHPPAVIGQGYMTALYYQALGDGCEVAALQGDQKLVDHYLSLKSKIQPAFQRELWNSKEGLFRDGKPNQTHVAPNQWLPADKEIETFSTQVNTLAVSCGLANAEQNRPVMSKVLARAELNCQPYFMHFVFDAMAKSGLYSQFAAKHLGRWVIQPDTHSMYEMWSVGDLSHAWNATPLFQMSGRILGIKATGDGYSKFEIALEPLQLSWAEGTVPTPHGPIHVRWDRQGEGLRIKFSVPKGTFALVGPNRYGPGTHETILTEASMR